MLESGDFYYRVEVQDQSTGYWKSAKMLHHDGSTLIICNDIYPEYKIDYCQKTILFFKWYNKSVRRLDFDFNQRQKALGIAKSLPPEQVVRIAKYGWNKARCESKLEEVVWREGKWL